VSKLIEAITEEEPLLSMRPKVDRSDREAVRNAKYAEECDRLRAELKAMEAKYTEAYSRATRAEDALHQLAQKHPIRVAAATALRSLADRWERG